ncbi:MAG: hypothetical protein ACK5MI_02155 [Mangrovibacterium sp.]
MAIYEKLRTNIRLSALSGLSNRMIDFYATKDLASGLRAVCNSTYRLIGTV